MVFRDIVNNSDEKIVELIVLNKNDLAAGKINYVRIHEREFKLDGKLYDVVRKEENDENIFFYCINDKREEELVSSFLKLIVNNLNNETTPSTIKNIYKIMILEAVFSIQFCLSFNVQQTYLIFPHRIKITNPSLEIPTPPPKQLIPAYAGT